MQIRTPHLGGRRGLQQLNVPLSPLAYPFGSGKATFTHGPAYPGTRQTE